MAIGVGKHKTAPDDTNGRLDRDDVGVDGGCVEIATAAGGRLRGTGVAVDLEVIRAGGFLDENAQPPDARDGAVGGLFGEKVGAQ